MAFPALVLWQSHLLLLLQLTLLLMLHPSLPHQLRAQPLHVDPIGRMPMRLDCLIIKFHYRKTTRTASSKCNHANVGYISSSQARRAESDANRSPGGLNPAGTYFYSECVMSILNIDYAYLLKSVSENPNSLKDSLKIELQTPFEFNVQVHTIEELIRLKNIELQAPV
ncbi:hypothetical protein CAPTEDRAFT_201458 [Capitella teleta]|uniref:Uncharacterized protein n=1 Tax=Capitella teleta TaxID=283909 RepID=R7UUZ5_CAPTE|nr:hypothetical protein CAPTEDRAFT_201458 [Capitella teleta]|eukprot:ELU10458.1 hypothetical protein CAPTEDRAFT_201458 [Capitella teleta]